jgi:hypothetical protein
VAGIALLVYILQVDIDELMAKISTFFSGLVNLRVGWQGDDGSG